MTPDEPVPDQVRHETGGCLTVPFTDEDGKQSWIRFILADEDLHRETAASLGQPFFSDEAYQAMIKDQSVLMRSGGDRSLSNWHCNQ